MLVQREVCSLPAAVRRTPQMLARLRAPLMMLEQVVRKQERVVQSQMAGAPVRRQALHCSAQPGRWPLVATATSSV